MNKQLLLLCAATLCTVAAGYSQENKKNKVPSEVISVEKGYNPEVKTGRKAAFAPEESPEASTKLPVSYRSQADAPQFDFAAQPVSALVAAGTQAGVQYPNYIRGGIGYNISSLLDGYFSRTWGKTTVSAGINHDRAVRDISFFKDNSVFSHTDASVSAKHSFSRYDLAGFAKYSYNAFTNNGTRLNEFSSPLPLVLRHNGITAGVSLRSGSGREILNHITVEGSYMNGANETKDAYIKGSAGLQFPVRKVTLSLDLAAAYYKNKAVNDTYPLYVTAPTPPSPLNMLITDFAHFMVTPAVTYKNDRLDLYAGARMELLSGNRLDESKFHIMPEIKASYSFLDGLMNVYGRLESGYQVQNMSTLFQANPFMSPASPAFYTHDKFKATVGLSGVFSSAVRYDVSASYGQQANAPAWIMVAQSIGQEYLSYYTAWMDDVNTFSLKASAEYTINPDHRVSAFAQYLNHSSEYFRSALYAPDFRLGASYRGSVVKNKIDLSGRIAYNGPSTGYVATDIDGGQYVDVGGYVEFQASAAYNFTPRWSLFAEANNTIDGRAVKFYGYDWCGVRALVGVRFNF